MPTLTEGQRAGEHIISESAGVRSRDSVTITVGDYPAGKVLGEQYATTADVTGNTGNGVVGAVTLGNDFEEGVYTLTCTAAAANAGTFEVLTPSGNLLPDLTVAVVYAGSHINLTIADGATDFIVGDTVTLDVAGSDTFIEHDPAATDGSQVASAVLYDAVDASAADAAGVVTTRDAELLGSGLTWKTSISAADKTAGINALAKRGVIIR